MIREDHHKTASAQIKALAAKKFRGVKVRGLENLSETAAAAAKYASKDGKDWFCVATAFGWRASPKSDARATYHLQGGMRITAEGDVFSGFIVLD